MHESISYIRPDGIEINLCNYYADKNLYELVGRKGFEAPRLYYTDIAYAHGYSKTVAIKIEPRDVTIQMVVIGENTLRRDEILHKLAKDLIIYGSVDNTGKLKILRSDGKALYLNCWYTGGIDDIVEMYSNFHKFQLTFHAADPYFYDSNDTIFTIRDTENNGLYLGENVYLGDDVYFIGRLSEVARNIINDGVVTYPVITVVGPAKNIWFINEATGKIIKMKSDFILQTGEKLIIDTREGKRSVKYIVDDEPIDAISSLDIQSTLIWELLPMNNNVVFHFTDITIATTIEFNFTKKYLSA